MLYKPDWPHCRHWLAAWHKHEVADHWALGVLAPRKAPLPAPPIPPVSDDLRERWLDFEYALAKSENDFARNYYGGVFTPTVTAGVGPGSLSLFLGARPLFMPETVWHEPAFTDPAAVDLRFDPENAYWQWTVRSLTRCREAAPGKFRVAMPDLLEGLDVLAQLFGSEALLMFLVDCPDEIHRLLAQVETVFLRAYDALHPLVVDEYGGNACATFQMWGPGRTLVTQCDFSAMISPAMFEEFVLPYLARCCARMDHAVYHLDGPNAIKHLPALLTVPGLTAIEWTPGTPNPYAADPIWWKAIWEPVYAAGKSAHVWAVPHQQIRPFLERFGQHGTLITTGCDSEAEARRLIEDSRNWGA